MIRKQMLTAALATLLVGSAVTAAATTDSSSQERVEHVIVQADYIGVSVGGQMPDFPNGPAGVTYTLEPDGSSVTLWASSEAGLDPGVTALWVGDLTADELTAVREYLSESGTQGTVAASGVIYCTVWADPPYYDEEDDSVKATGYHWCSGPWIRHKLDGRMLRKWGWFVWIIEDTDSTYWEYDDAEIQAYPTVSCYNSNTTTWRNRSTGTVEGSNGFSSVRSHNSDTITMDCGV